MTTTEAAPRPLDGVLVADLTRHLPGPFATRELLRLGARVVRLEAPEGDPLRAMAPGWHDLLNAGKESVVCDLKSDAEFGRDLCAAADVVVEGFRPGVVERLGVGPADLPATVVYCSIRGFDGDGPWSNRVGHDVNYLGLAGVLDPEAPSLPPVPIADLAAGGLTAVARVLAGLLERARTGRGSVHRVSMTDEAYRLVEFRRAGTERIASPLLGGLACYDLYRAADGRWLSVGALEPAFFRALTALLGCPELAAGQFDPEAQEELRARLAAAFASRAAGDWLAVLEGADTAVAPVVPLDEVTLAPDPLAALPARALGADTAAWRAALGAQGGAGCG
jgi:crotonobetainyl-CoA:carnitine CoA-transferase CaiB-like acyl-CoA transferase